jgi:hypothetical protein
MIKPYFWMNLAYYLGLKIIIKIGGDKKIGYLTTPKNQMGQFYLWSKKKFPSEMIMFRKTKEVEYVSIFWGFFFHKSKALSNSLVVENNKTKENSSRLISEFPVSLCVPVDGNISYLEIPPVKILDIPKPWENKSKIIYRKK